MRDGRSRAPRVLARHLGFLIAGALVLAGCEEGLGIVIGHPDASTDPVAHDPDVVFDPVVDHVVDPPAPEIVDVVDVVDEPDGWPCEPEFADQARTIFGGLTVSSGEVGDPDFPELLTLPNEQVWVMGRITSNPSATDTPKLTYVTVNPRNALPGGSWYHPVVSVDLGAMHPTAPLGDPPTDMLAMVTVFADVDGVWSNQLMYMPLGSPPSTGTPVPITGTGPGSTEPAVASGGARFMAVWRQEGSEGSTIDYAVVDALGVELAGGTVAGDGAFDLGTPVVVSTGSGYGVFWVERPSDSAPDLIGFTEVDALGSPRSGTRMAWLARSELLGRPAAAWDGSRYLVLWEEVDEVSPVAWLVSHSFVPGGSDREVELSAALDDETGPVTREQQGMMDIVWTGSRYGVVWVHLDPVTGRHVWFFELSRDGTIVNGPYNLNPASTQSNNPSIAWLETAYGLTYYVFAWNEFVSTSGVNVLYTHTYGCNAY